MTQYHFIGIGGTGLSPIARVLLERGNHVSGSDMLLSPLAQELINLGVPISIGHKAKNIKGADIVIRSSAIPGDNTEVIAAKKANIPVLKRVDFLQQLTEGFEVLAVAGTHGKTTSTAMLAWVLSELGVDLSYIIGGVSKDLGGNAHAGKSPYFVIEADEYDSMFLGLQAQILVVTNIEHDHPDYYPTYAEYYQAFQELVQRMQPSGMLFAADANQGAQDLGKWAREKRNVYFYGEQSSSPYRITSITHTKDCGVYFEVQLPATKRAKESPIHVQLKIPGAHNAYNVLAVIGVIHQLGFSISDAVTALERFSGTERRFDIQGIAYGVTIINDYAHHPTEIRSTLSAARCRYPDSLIWAVWQPHTYSRTQQLFTDFTRSFQDCDHVIVSEIYRSREKEQPYSAKTVVDAMQHADARFISDLTDITEFLLAHLQPGDVLLVLSAGDADQVSRDVLAGLQTKDTKQVGAHE